ncbi:spondin domain-containing protein [Vibrio sp. SS-MA-C1-2]|nr:spondin domain-containing protein [Vibrio sp. SS-MA-C1-2]
MNDTNNLGYLSLAGMLLPTNDGFIGKNNLMISNLAIDEMISYSLTPWDAGTEYNSESSTTLPAAGGEGYNSERVNAEGFISVHRGVLTDQELSTSALEFGDRFDGPMGTLTIKRIE